MNLNDDIQKILGVAPAPPPVPVFSYKPPQYEDWCPQRPTPKYQYTVDVYSSRYASVTVEAADKSDARDLAWAYDDWDWEDGDMDISNVELDDKTPVNQSDLDDWDEEYGQMYTEDGEPMCSECNDAFGSATELTPDADDHNRWYCATCAPPAE